MQPFQLIFVAASILVIAGCGTKTVTTTTHPNMGHTIFFAGENIDLVGADEAFLLTSTTTGSMTKVSRSTDGAIRAPATVMGNLLVDSFDIATSDGRTLGRVTLVDPAATAVILRADAGRDSIGYVTLNNEDIGFVDAQEALFFSADPLMDPVAAATTSLSISVQ